MSRRGALFLIGALTALLIITGGAWLMFGPRRGMPAQTAGHTKAAVFFCPMHPRMTSDHPGDCPICGMRMVPREDDERDAAQGPAPEGTAAPGRSSSPAESPPRGSSSSTASPSTIVLQDSASRAVTAAPRDGEGAGMPGGPEPARSTS